MSVWAVVAHFGDPAITARAVVALLDGAVAPDVVLVIDNQGDLAALEGVDLTATARGASPVVQFVRPAHNVGFAGACAEGSRRALAAGAEWVWLFNNDAVADPGCLSELLAAAAAFPRAGLLSPVISLRGGAGFWYAGGEVAPGTLQVTHHAEPRKTAPHGTGFITGCAWLARSAFIADCGPPDASLFLYFEDVDWTLRARAAGWDTLLVPAALVTHDVEYVDGRRVFSSIAVYYMSRNRLLVARRWGSLPAAFVGAVSWGARQVLKCRSRAAAASVMTAVLAGLRDGLVGRRGPIPLSLARRLG